MSATDTSSALDRLKELAAGPPPVESEEAAAAVAIFIPDYTQQQIAFVVQCCWLDSTETGKLEPPDYIFSRYEKYLVSVGLDLIKTQALWRNEEFHRAIYLRGIRNTDNGLDGRMILALQVLTDFTSSKTPMSKLKAIGVKPFEYQAWLNYEPFRKRLAILSQKALGGGVSNAKVALANKASSGDLQAIKFLFEVTGEHDPVTKAQFDGMKLVQGMAEIMMTYIKDPEQLREIAAKVQVLIASQGLGELQV